MTQTTLRTTTYALLALCLLTLASSAASAYPRVELGSSADYYVATGGLPSVRYVDERSVAYVTGADGSTYQEYAGRTGFEDPYAQAYYTGYSQARQYYRSYYDDDWDDDERVIRIGGEPYYPHPPYNFYDVRYGREDNRPGLDCNFGRSDICFYRYEECESGWCRIGDSDIANYNYYNPYNVPGYYPIDTRYDSSGWY